MQSQVLKGGIIFDINWETNSSWCGHIPNVQEDSKHLSLLWGGEEVACSKLCQAESRGRKVCS